jgi:hypothetical protein
MKGLNCEKARARPVAAQMVVDNSNAPGAGRPGSINHFRTNV